MKNIDRIISNLKNESKKKIFIKEFVKNIDNFDYLYTFNEYKIES